jgi:hypothetical protein
MLWHKAWLETRWRFIIPLIVMVCSTVGVVFTWPTTKNTLVPLASTVNTDGEIGRQIREALELSKTYPGYIFGQLWEPESAPDGNALCRAARDRRPAGADLGRGALFTLSLPASRNHILGVRAAIGFAEFFAIVFWRRRPHPGVFAGGW